MHVLNIFSSAMHSNITVIYYVRYTKTINATQPNPQEDGELTYFTVVHMALVFVIVLLFIVALCVFLRCHPIHAFAVQLWTFVKCRRRSAIFRRSAGSTSPMMMTVTRSAIPSRPFVPNTYTGSLSTFAQHMSTSIPDHAVVLGLTIPRISAVEYTGDMQLQSMV